MSAGYKPQDDDGLQDAWAEQRERDKLRKLFEDWCVAADFAYRQNGRIWFHRNGGDGMWEAFQAGANIGWRTA